MERGHRQMYIIVDERNIVAGGYASSFDREGVTTAGIDPKEFKEWIGKVSDVDVKAVEAFLIGDCSNREVFPRLTAKGPAHRFFASTTASRLMKRCSFSPLASTMWFESRFTCAKFSRVWAPFTGARSVRRVT